MNLIKEEAVRKFRDKVHSYCTQFDIVSESDFNDNASICQKVVLGSVKINLLLNSSDSDEDDNDDDSSDDDSFSSKDIDNFLDKIKDNLESQKEKMWLEQKIRNAEQEKRLQVETHLLEQDFRRMLISNPHSKISHLISTIHDKVWNFSSTFTCSSSSPFKENVSRQLEKSLFGIHKLALAEENEMKGDEPKTREENNGNLTALNPICDFPPKNIQKNQSEEEEKIRAGEIEREEIRKREEKGREAKRQREEKEQFDKMSLEWTEKALNFYREEMKRNFRLLGTYFPPDRLKILHAEAVKYSLDKIPSTLQLRQQLSPTVQELLDKVHREFESKNKMNTPTSFAIGIDLGTTFSCVGVYINGKVEIIPNELGEKTTPSFIHIQKKTPNSTANPQKKLSNFSFLVGAAAKRQAFKFPESTVYEVKRLLGKEFKGVEEDIQKWPFKVVEERGEPKVLIDEVTHHPIDISSQILRKMKETAETYLQCEVKYAVITVPAYFSERQKQATKEAGERAGLKVLRIINEPTSAAIAYNLNWNRNGTGNEPGSEKKGRTGLVFDLGGGTLDVALFSAAEGKIDILKVGGDAHLGGVDFDNELVQHCIQEFEKESGIDLLEDANSSDLTSRMSYNRKLMRLKAHCERDKVHLSTAQETTVAMECIHGSVDLTVRIRRSTFEQLIQPHLKKAIQCVSSTLEEANLSPQDVDDIVLVGGSTRIPKVQEMLQSLFKGKTLNTTINPDEAVAVGAAYEAAVLNGERAQKEGDIQSEGRRGLALVPKGMSIQDVTPMSLGIEVEGGKMSVLIPKQSKVPCQVSNVYTTLYNNQTSVPIAIYEGNEATVDLNNFVGEFHLNGIPPGIAGAHKVNVTMIVSRDGMVDVTATCVENGKEKTLSVRANRKKRSGMIAPCKK